MPKTGPFDTYCDAYDEWFEKNSELYHTELEAIRRLVPSPCDKGVEVGVGSARFAAALGIPIGVEPSLSMALRAKKRGVQVVRGVAEALPFSNGGVAFVTMVTTICFVDDIPLSFREAYRVLRPGGCLIVGFIDKESELGAQYARDREKSRFYKEATLYSVREVSKAFKYAGFSRFKLIQTLVPGEPAGSILDGSGKGAFVVIRGDKPLIA